MDDIDERGVPKLPLSGFSFVDMDDDDLASTGSTKTNVKAFVIRFIAGPAATPYIPASMKRPGCMTGLVNELQAFARW
jgi:hypothetical protein